MEDKEEEEEREEEEEEEPERSLRILSEAAEDVPGARKTPTGLAGSVWEGAGAEVAVVAWKVVANGEYCTRSVFRIGASAKGLVVDVVIVVVEEELEEEEEEEEEEERDEELFVFLECACAGAKTTS